MRRLLQQRWSRGGRSEHPRRSGTGTDLGGAEGTESEILDPRESKSLGADLTLADAFPLGGGGGAGLAASAAAGALASQAEEDTLMR